MFIIYLKVFRILFKVHNTYIKKLLSFDFKKSGCATEHPHWYVAPPLLLGVIPIDDANGTVITTITVRLQPK
jgi:hypothetical protein